MKREKWEAKSSKGFTLIFVFAIIILMAGGFFYLRNEESVWRRQALNQLKNSSTRLAQMVEEWRNEVFSDTKEIAKSPFLQDAVSRWTIQKGNAKLENQIRESLWLVVKNNPDFADIFISDTIGQNLLVTGKGEINDLNHKKLIDEVLKTNEEVFGDLFKSNRDGKTYIDIAHPVFNSNNRISLVIIFRLNAAIRLFPILQAGFSDSTTEESFLFEKDGDSVSFMSDLKYTDNGTFSIKIPLSSTENPAVRAITNGPGFYDGIGYNNKQILEYILPISNSPWFLASKIDRDELFQEAHQRVITLFFILFLIFLSLSTILFLIIIFRRKQYYNQLFEDEQRQAALKSHYESVVKYANDIILLEDENLNIIEANERAQQTYQYSLEELLKMKITGLVAPESKQILEGRLKNITENDGAMIESVHQRKDGSLFDVEISARIIRIDGRSFLHQVIRDITESKLAEKALQSSDERSQLVSRATNDAIWDWDLLTNQLFWNENFQHLFGYNSEEIEPGIESWTNRLHPDDLDRVTNGIHLVIDSGEQFWSDEYRFRHKDGMYLDVFDRGYIMQDNNGKPVRMIGALQDITKRKLAEEQIKTVTKRLQLATESAQIGIWDYDLKQNLLLWDQRMYELYGIQPEDFCGAYEAWEKGLHPDDLITARAEIQDAIAGKKGFHTQFRVVWPDGQVRFIEAHAVVVQSASDGSPQRMTGANWDITERVRAEKHLRKTLTDLERSNKELEQFAYVASHDLQEPLRMISSYTQLLERRYKDKLDQDANDFMNYAVDGANRMQTLINDLLDYSRVTTKGKELQPVDANSALGQAIVNLRQKIKSTSAIVVNDELPVIRADEGQLIRLFQNLIGNAIKYSGGESPRIHISCKDFPELWQFSVQDNGIGIAEEFKERIFVIFQRLHSRKDYPGTGIGLAICKRIVERHNGKIWVEPAPEKGTIFYFTISKRSKNDEYDNNR